MRLWHQDLIPYFPRQQLLGQHRECCALRGKGWGKKRSTVDYVFTHSPSYLIAYHNLVMDQMQKQGYNVEPLWREDNYRGKSLGMVEDWAMEDLVTKLYNDSTVDYLKIFPEHNTEYLQECLDNLKAKGIYIDMKGE